MNNFKENCKSLEKIEFLEKRKAECLSWYTSRVSLNLKGITNAWNVLESTREQRKKRQRSKLLINDF